MPKSSLRTFSEQLQRPQMRLVWTETNQPEDLAAYTRMALFMLSNSRVPCVAIRMPSGYLSTVLKAVDAEYPGTKHLMLEEYNNHGHVLLWRVPDVDPDLRKESHMTTFNGGSPVSSASNPYNDAATIARQGDILPSLDVAGAERQAMTNLDAYGSSPVTEDSAAQRPMDPPSTQP